MINYPTRVVYEVKGLEETVKALVKYTDVHFSES